MIRAKGPREATGPRPEVAAGASEALTVVRCFSCAPEFDAPAPRSVHWALLGGVALAGGLSAMTAHAESPPPLPVPSLTDDDILASEDRELRLVSVRTRLSAYNQFGTGYQSKSGPILGPGSERLTVFEPQTEIVATQGARITHRLWVPIDVLSSASPSSIPKPVDVVSGASRHNVGGTVQWATTYRKDSATEIAATTGLHLEEPFRSWNAGLGASRALADQNTLISGSLVSIFDWFDNFLTSGARQGRTVRSSTFASASLTQVLSETTLVNVNYGVTWQQGELGNTWNAVPLEEGIRGAEILPRSRVRHALVGRASQFLPWNGALRLYYRFYADTWGVVAHSAAVELLQRIAPSLYVSVLTRVHTQTAAAFFTTLAQADGAFRTADSDLASLQSATIGAKVVLDGPGSGLVHSLHYEVELDRYARTNDMRIDLVTCALGLRF